MRWQPLYKAHVSKLFRKADVPEGYSVSQGVRMQLPDEDQSRFAEAVAALGPDYAFEPLPVEAQNVFEMFIQ